jgi:CRISPR-associated protein (TIGR03986 family)
MQNNLKPFKSWTDQRTKIKHYKGEKNNSYTPYAIEVSYELSGVRNVTGIAAKGKLSHNGYLVSTGEIPEKKVIYVIPQIDEKGEAIDIPQEDIDNFKRDYEGRKTQVSEAFALPQNGKTKPVFYIKLEGDKKLYFGYTPRLRLFYDKTIHDGICKEQKNVAIDYCKSIFGYSNDKESYKSRVSFMDALTLSDSAMPKETKLLLGMPKPTSCLDYLTSDKNEAVSYNDNFKLRGVKQYWLRKGTIKGEPVQNDKIASVLRPCAKGTRFKGSIRFENLSDSELGMLLWSLLLEKNSNQNIGKGKPYGYGRIAVKLSGLKVLDFDKMYGDDILSIDPYIDMTDKAKDYIKAAKDDMTAFLGRDVMTMPRIRDFLLMKDTTKIPDSEDTRYMRISVKVENGKDYNEYQKRDNNVVKLPTVKEVVERKPLQSLKSKKQK